MISKELLSEVLQKEAEIGGKSILGESYVEYKIVLPSGGKLIRDVNIYELAHKCKEWAYTKYKIILTSKLFDYQIKNIFDCYLETGEKSRENIRNFAHPDFISNTEPEAIFKACQWILENK